MSGTIVPEPLTIAALHGTGGSAAHFARVSQLVPPTVRFVPITLPGCGGHAREPRLRTLRDYAAWLHERLAREPRPLVLLGHDSGAAIALEYAQHERALLDALILHAPAGPRRAGALLPPLMAVPGVPALARRLIAARPLRPLWRHVFFSQPAPPADLDRFFDAYRQCHVLGQLVALTSTDWLGRLRPTYLPAALLWGDRERVLAAKMDAYRRVLLQPLVCVVPGWDRWPMIARPTEYARTVVDLAEALVIDDRRAALDAPVWTAAR